MATCDRAYNYVVDSKAVQPIYGYAQRGEFSHDCKNARRYDN
jgi:hypothetical protein